MRYISCNLCGADDARERYPATLPEGHQPEPGSAFLCTSPDYRQHYRIVQCRKCGFVYANPRGETQAVLSAYESIEDPLYEEERDGRRHTFRRHLAPLHRITGAPAGRRLLDVGAYTGVFVEVAREAGWDAEGVEPSLWATRQANQAGLPVRQGTLASAGFPAESFEVVTLWDVMEHFADPRGELDQICRLLKPGGVVVAHTMDIDSPTARLMGRDWPFLMEMHTVFFSRATMRAMLERVGFEFLSDHIQGRYLRLGYLVGRVRAAFGPLVSWPFETVVNTLRLRGIPVPVNTLDVFTVYARKPGQGEVARS
jgi:2-polyprenyl-3-methyl-5-hydroxy-6-metoxy-1,4-benzoquinol methylase